MTSPTGWSSSPSLGTGSPSSTPTTTTRPTWPPGDRAPQQFHIDLTVDDINVAEPAPCWRWGRGKHDVQPGEAAGEAFRVYLDPVGHPFCLCWD